MDVLQILKKDHKMVKDMFTEFARLAERGTQKKSSLLIAEICQALSVHAQVEEELFYPALRKIRSKELMKLVDEAAEEHHVAKQLTTALGDRQPQEGRTEAKVTVLGEYVLHHVKEEEQEMFKLVKQHLSADALGALGEQVAARRSALQAEAQENNSTPRRRRAA